MKEHLTCCHVKWGCCTRQSKKQDLDSNLKEMGAPSSRRQLLTRCTEWMGWHFVMPARSPCSRRRMLRPAWSWPKHSKKSWEKSLLPDEIQDELFDINSIQPGLGNERGRMTQREASTRSWCNLDSGAEGDLTAFQSLGWNLPFHHKKILQQSSDPWGDSQDVEGNVCAMPRRGAEGALIFFTRGKASAGIHFWHPSGHFLFHTSPTRLMWPHYANPFQ